MGECICTLFLLLSLLSIQTLCLEGDGLALVPNELTPIPCNDRAVEKLSRLAVTYINEDRDDGYKFALNRIANVHLHAQGPAGNVYYLDLDVLETKCHIGSPKPWKRCDVRPFMETQISGNCNTTILHTQDGYSYLYSYDCFLVPDSEEKLQRTCPTCPVLLADDSPVAMSAAQVTLQSYKRKSLLGAGLGVKKITRVAAQTVPVKATFVEYTVQQCPEGITERETCQRLTIKSDTETTGFCTGSVIGDFNAHPEVQVSCEMFKVQNVDILTPLQPQVLDLPEETATPTLSPPVVDDPGYYPEPEPEPELIPVPADPTLPPVTQPEPFDPAPAPPAPAPPAPAPPAPAPPAPAPPAPAPPAPAPPAPFIPPVVSRPSDPFLSSSSESFEVVLNQQQPPAAGVDSAVSSSEEIGAMRPPFNFRYQRRDRKKRQALIETEQPTHDPVFLTDFPNGRSPFRSCPGPSRYTTV